MLPLSLIRAQHFVASWAGVASIKEFPCPFCLLLPQKAAGFVLPSPFAMAVCFSDHGGWCRGLPSCASQTIALQLGMVGVLGVVFWRSLCCQRGKTRSFSCSRGNCSNSFGSSPYKAMELRFV